MKWRFDRHGRLRASLRNVPGALVEIALKTHDDEREGRTPGTLIRVARVNGGRLAVLFWPGRTLVVHSVWWETE